MSLKCLDAIWWHYNAILGQIKTFLVKKYQFCTIMKLLTWAGVSSLAENLSKPTLVVLKFNSFTVTEHAFAHARHETPQLIVEKKHHFFNIELRCLSHKGEFRSVFCRTFFAGSTRRK